MLNFGPTFIWTIINLGVLYFILRAIFFKPVTKFMENRAASIKNDLDNAEKARVEAAELKQKYDEQLKAARKEADDILADARSRGEQEYKNLVDEARGKAEQILKKAREEVELERQRMLREVKAEIAGLALSAASRVIEANMDTESNRALVNKFIDEAGAA